MNDTDLIWRAIGRLEGIQMEHGRRLWIIEQRQQDPKPPRWERLIKRAVAILAPIGAAVATGFGDKLVDILRSWLL